MNRRPLLINWRRKISQCIAGVLFEMKSEDVNYGYMTFRRLVSPLNLEFNYIRFKLFFQCNKTDVELDLFEEASISVVWLGRFAPIAK